MPIIGNFGGGGGNVTSDGKTHLSLEDVFGPGPYEIEFTEDDEGGAFAASDITYDNSESGLAAENAQEAIDEMADNLKNFSAVGVKPATIGTTWTEDENTGIKYQVVAIEGVTAENTAKVDHAYTGDGTSEGYETFVEAENQYLTYITNGYAETVAGGIKFVIFGDAPTVSIPIIVEVV